MERVKESMTRLVKLLNIILDKDVAETETYNGDLCLKIDMEKFFVRLCVGNKITMLYLLERAVSVYRRVNPDDTLPFENFLFSTLPLLVNQLRDLTGLTKRTTRTNKKEEEALINTLIYHIENERRKYKKESNSVQEQAQ